VHGSVYDFSAFHQQAQLKFCCKNAVADFAQVLSPEHVHSPFSLLEH
jgi:hypothetical protein